MFSLIFSGEAGKRVETNFFEERVKDREALQLLR